MKDVFGNWVIQKFFEFGDQNHKRLFVMIMKGHVMDLTTQMYGCRVVQRVRMSVYFLIFSPLKS